MMIGEKTAAPVREAASASRADRDAHMVLDHRGPARSATARGRQDDRDRQPDVHAGEIVGIAGVSGNGQKELVEVLGGQLPRRRAARCWSQARAYHAAAVARPRPWRALHPGGAAQQRLRRRA